MFRWFYITPLGKGQNLWGTLAGTIVRGRRNKRNERNKKGGLRVFRKHLGGELWREISFERGLKCFWLFKTLFSRYHILKNFYFVLWRFRFRFLEPCSLNNTTKRETMHEISLVIILSQCYHFSTGDEVAICTTSQIVKCDMTLSEANKGTHWYLRYIIESVSWLRNNVLRNFQTEVYIELSLKIECDQIMGKYIQRYHYGLLYIP